MPMKIDILIDTNIFIYAYDIESPFHQKASSLLLDTTYELHTTTKNVSEYFAVLSKQNAPFQLVWRFYEDLKNNIPILFPDNQSLLVLEELLKKYQPRGNKVFDLEIVSIALAHQINTIATVNAKDFDSFSEITVLSI